MTVGPVTIAGAGRRPTEARTTIGPRCPSSDRKWLEELESSTRGDCQLQSRYVRRNIPTRALFDLTSREMRFSGTLEGALTRSLLGTSGVLVALLAGLDMLLMRPAAHVFALRFGVGARSRRVLVALLPSLHVLFVRAARGILPLRLRLGSRMGRILGALSARLYVLLMRAASSSRHLILLVSGMV